MFRGGGRGTERGGLRQPGGIRCRGAGSPAGGLLRRLRPELPGPADADALGARSSRRRDGDDPRGRRAASRPRRGRDRKSGVEGKRVSVRVALGVSGINQKKNKSKNI